MLTGMDMISNEINCNAVSIYGKVIDRLMECAKVALETDLMSGFNPD